MNRTPPENLPETPSARRPGGCRGGLFQASLKAYLDGETSAIRGWLVRGHLAQCAECREELRWLRRLGEDMKELESTRPRPELRARILAALPTTPPAPGIRVVHMRSDRERSPQFMPRLALAGGFAMLLAFSSVFALKRSAGAPLSGQAGLGKSVKVPQDSIAQDVAGAENSTPDAMMVTYIPQDDPNNAVAEKMFRDKMAERDREQALVGQDDWHRLLAQARTVAQKTDTAKTTEMGVSLAVADISSMRAHLPTWAKQQGADFVAIGKQSSEPADTMTGLPLRTEDPRANMIAFYVPAQRGPAFLGALKQFGQISALPLTPNSTPAATRQVAASIRTEASAEGRPRAIPTAPVTPDPGVTAERVAETPEKHLKASRYLVLTVLLTTLHN